MDSVISSCRPYMATQTQLVSGIPDTKTANGVVAIANPDRQIQSDQPEQPDVPLSRRLIFPFKAAANRMGFIATGSLLFGLFPGAIAGVVVGIATMFTCCAAFVALGGLIQLVSTLAGRPSKAIDDGFCLAAIVTTLIVVLVGGAVTVAAGLPVFGVITAAESIFHLPTDIYSAATWTEEDMNNLDRDNESIWEIVRTFIHRLFRDDDFEPAALVTEFESDKPELIPAELSTKKIAF